MKVHFTAKLLFPIRHMALISCVQRTMDTMNRQGKDHTSEVWGGVPRIEATLSHRSGNARGVTYENTV